MVATALLQPVLALVGWTLIMQLWLYRARIPAIQAAKIDLDELARTGGTLDLPPTVTRVADNYNHLHEQPTLFYALALAGAVAGISSGPIVIVAWVYVGLRIAHSLIQATINKIVVRFALFSLSSACLAIMLWFAVGAVF